MNLFFCTPIQESYIHVKEGFTHKLFESLTPWWMPTELSRFDGCKPGDEVHLLVGPFKQKWLSRITKEEKNEQGWSFTDEGTILPWPLSRWRHEHRVDRTNDQQCQIIDDISFDCRPEFLAGLMWPVLWLVFSSRPKSYVKFFSRNA